MARQIVPFGSSDKLLNEVWTPGRDLANIPSPFRMLLLGGPGSGKTMLIKNLVIHQKPYFDEVFVVHEDALATREYQIMDPTAMLEEIPALDFWDDLPTEMRDEASGKMRPVKRLCIVDDLEYTRAHRDRLKNLAILFRYASSHKGISICLAHQSYFDVPILVKKVSNVFVLWRPRALNELTLIANRCGLEKTQLTELFRKHCPDARDSITIDFTRNTPAMMRLNLWTVIPAPP